MKFRNRLIPEIPQTPHRAVALRRDVTYVLTNGMRPKKNVFMCR